MFSYTFWRTHLGGGESAMGSTLALCDQPFTTVGVTPRRFTGLEVGETLDVALPVCAAALWDGRVDRRDHWGLTIIMGRLKPDWTINGDSNCVGWHDPSTFLGQLSRA